MFGLSRKRVSSGNWIYVDLANNEFENNSDWFWLLSVGREFIAGRRPLLPRDETNREMHQAVWPMMDVRFWRTSLEFGSFGKRFRLGALSGILMCPDDGCQVLDDLLGIRVIYEICHLVGIGIQVEQFAGGA